MIVENKHRLALELYQGLIRISFTLCIKDRKNIFTNSNIVKTFVDILRKSINKHVCINWVYLFMPDHIHIILEGITQNSNPYKAICLFKQTTGYWLTKNFPTVYWQKGFFDHIHRKDKDLKTHMHYILHNPIRKKLTTNWQDYPYKGSLNFILEKIIT